MIKKLVPNFVKEHYRHYLAGAYILSYPKSGRTWLRMLIGTVLNDYFQLELEDGQKAALSKLTKPLRSFPTIRLLHDDDPGITPYRQLSQNKNRFAGKKVILMVRDPRDVVVSAYYQYKFRMNREDLKDTSLSDFLKGDTGGLHSIIEYLNSWAVQIPKHPQLFILRYEDLKMDGLSSLREIMLFLGLETDDPCLSNALSENDFTRLKKKEKSGELNSDFFGTQKPGDENASKVRKGKVGGYRDELSTGDIAWMDELINSELSGEFSYYKT